MSNVRRLPRTQSGASSCVHLRALPEDELAVAYLVHDDDGAFEELYRRLTPYLLAVARRRVRSTEDAADLVQQAFLNAHSARERFDLGCGFRPWITRIVVNLAVDHCRTARRRPRAELDPVELAAPPQPDAPERRDDVIRTRRALEALRPRQRQVVEMHWIEERPFPEVAAALGEQVSAVKVRAHRAYRELRQALDSA